MWRWWGPSRSWWSGREERNTISKGAGLFTHFVFILYKDFSQRHSHVLVRDGHGVPCCRDVPPRIAD